MKLFKHKFIFLLVFVQIFLFQISIFADIIKNIKINGLQNSLNATLIVEDSKELILYRDKKRKSYFAYENFENVLLCDNVRIFYTLAGEHALVDKFKTDSNNNKVPDFIEDIMTESLSTKLLLDSYGFNLFNKKNHMYNYQNIKFLDIIISNYKEKRRRSAYFSGYRDNIRYNIISKNNIIDGKPILMRVHQPGRRYQKSVPHEIFHAYQYSSTRLLNAWFTEGSAVWFEHAFFKRCR